MKKIYSFMVAAVAVFGAVACTQELDNNVPEANGETVVFTAYADGADETKTVLNGTNSLWKAGDRIWILNGKEGDAGWKKGYSTTDEKAAKAVFTEEDNSYPLEGTQYFAVYPASAADDATWEGGDNDINGVKLSSNQTATPGSYDPEAHIAVAKSETTSLSFKNAVSLLKFTVKNEGVKSVTIYANEKGLLTGSCNISAEGNVTPWTGEGEAKGWVELSAGEGTFAVGEEYYVAVFPNTDATNLTKGFTVEFSFDGSTKLAVKSYTEALTLNRKQILDLGDLEYVEPDPVTINLVPGQWASDGAWFAVAYNGGVYKMTMDDNGYYTYELPGYVEAFAFWRMNPASEDLTEANRWNEIPDVPVPTDENNYYIWSNWNAPYGAWGPKPAEKTYGIVGEFDWNNDIQMEKVASGIYAAKNVTAIEPFTEWKIRVNGAWDESYTSNITGIEANKWVAIGGSGNLTHAVDGAIDIYIDIKQLRIYVMSAGTDYSTAVQQTASTTPPPAGIPVKEGYVYLKPDGGWSDANARFAAYFFGGTGNDWIELVAVEGAEGYYECEKQGTHTSVIFCRYDPNTTGTGWTNWGQTVDLSLSDGNLFTTTGWSDGKGVGKWSTVTEL